MKSKLKSTVFFALALVMVLSVCFIEVNDTYAEDASVTLAIWPETADVGETVTVTVTIKGESVGNYDFSLKYPSGLVSNSSGTDGILPISGTGATSVSFSFVTTAEGNAYFSTTNGEFYNSEGAKLNVVAAGGQLTIGKKTEATTEKEEEQEDKKEEQDESNAPSVLYKMDGLQYTIINKPDDVKLPEGFEESDLKINDVQLIAYKDSYGSDLYLVYAINADEETGAYYYDPVEGTLIRYESVKYLLDAATASDAVSSDEQKEELTESQPVKKATPLIADKKTDTDQEDEGFLGKKSLKRLLIMMIIIFVIMCVVIIILIVKNGILQNRLYGDEEDDEDDEDEDGPIIRNGEKQEDNGIEESSDEGYIAKTGKNHSYGVNEDTGEILIEEALDNNSGVNVPPAEDDISNIEKAMKERPYGVDSAFEVVPAEEVVPVEQEPQEPVETVPQEPVEQVPQESVEQVPQESVESMKKKTEREDPEPQKVVLPGQMEEEDY